MSRVSFLLDEQMPVFIVDALLLLEPTIEVVQVGVEPGTPPKGTSDPDVLKFAEVNSYALVTFDKTTMRDEAYRHVAKGQHTWGVFLFPDGHQLTAGKIANELLLVWVASEAEEWIDTVEFLPYK
jgi:hypothetical protein